MFLRTCHSGPLKIRISKQNYPKYIYIYSRNISFKYGGNGFFSKKNVEKYARVKMHKYSYSMYFLRFAGLSFLYHHTCKSAMGDVDGGN